jgi:hypothetical protein
MELLPSGYGRSTSSMSSHSYLDPFQRTTTVLQNINICVRCEEVLEVEAHKLQFYLICISRFFLILSVFLKLTGKLLIPSWQPNSIEA